MKFDNSTARASVTIDGLDFTVPQPFGEGHVCTANEASALNQLLVENTRNNFAQKIKRAKEKSEEIPEQADLDAYVAGYEFGVRSVVSSDPVQVEARDIVLPHVKASIQKAGGKISDFSNKDLMQKCDEIIARNPQVLEQARKLVAEKAKIGSQELVME